jgi:hypothetical protein
MTGKYSQFRRRSMDGMYPIAGNMKWYHPVYCGYSMAWGRREEGKREREKDRE